MKHIGTDYRSQPYIEQAFREERIDPSGFHESRALGCSSAVHGEIASEWGSPITAGVEGKGVGGMRSSLSVSKPPSLRALAYDEEFYEMFSEIRLP